MDTEQRHEPISAALPMRLHLPHAAFVLVTARVHYTPQDPYAVRLTFHPDARPEPAIVWYLGRDLMRDGLIRRTGQGDAQIDPGPHGSDVVLFRLRDNECDAVLTAPRRRLAAFLRRTAEAVPYGREADLPLVWAELEAALARALTDAD